jgi:hypothetical protein
MKSGGKREGAGRPKAAPTRVTRIRLLVPDHDKLTERGGDVYAKRVILDALEKDQPKGVKDDHN